MTYEEMIINSKRKFKECKDEEKRLEYKFNEIELKEYIINDKSKIYLSKIYENTHNFVFIELYYIYDKDKNIIEKVKAKKYEIRRILMCYKYFLEKHNSFLFTDDNIDVCLKYLKNKIA